MITNVPVAINAAQRAVTLKHPNSLDCTVYRKVLLRTSDEMMGGLPTLGGLGVLKSEDEPDYEYQHVGMARILITSRFEGEMLDDSGDVVIADQPMQEAQIEPVTAGEFAIKKQDLIGAMLGGGVLIGFEVVGTSSAVNIYPYTPKWVIAPRDELHSLQPWTP